MITRENIEQLKSSWLSDPCWDIEHTEGFEAFHDELKAFHDEYAAKWKEEKLQTLKEQAKAIGCLDNLALAQYIFGLQNSINYLKGRVEKLEGY